MLQVLAAEREVGKGEGVVGRPRDFRTLVQDTLKLCIQRSPHDLQRGSECNFTPSAVCKGEQALLQ